MPRHAQLLSSFFKDRDIKKLLEENPDAVLLYLYYNIGSPNLLGIYQIDEKDDRVSIRYPLKKFENAKKSVENSGKIVFEGGWVWIVGKGNFIKGPKQWGSACKLLREIPSDLEIRKKFIKKYEKIMIGYGYGINRVSATALPIPIPIPKKRKHLSPTKEKKKSDPRVKELFQFWCFKYEETFGIEYPASFGRDMRILKNQLGWADNSSKIPPDCKVVFLAECMAGYLEEQEDREEKYKKPSIPGFQKAFSTIVTKVDWDNPNWEKAKKEYEGIREKIKAGGKNEQGNKV